MFAHPRRRVALAVFLTVLVTVPLTAFATHVFSDVSDTNVHRNSIAWLADSGVTRGCNPPDNDLFCPKDVVTREQMATFMYRLSGNDADTEPSVNAAALGGIPAASHVSGLQVVNEQYPQSFTNAGDNAGISLQCPEGTFVTGGGVSIIDNNGLEIRRSIPRTDLTGWTGGVTATINNASGILSIYAICATTVPATTD